MVCRSDEAKHRLRMKERQKLSELFWDVFNGPSRHAWSALDDARLLALMAVSAPPGIMAGITGRSVRATATRQSRLRTRHGLPRPSVQLTREQRDAALLAVLRDGMTRAAAAKRFNVTRNTIVGIVDRHRRRQRHANQVDA